jgi:hypothetical protein
VHAASGSRTSRQAQAGMALFYSPEEGIEHFSYARNDIVDCCYLSKVFALSKRRNAYWGYESAAFGNCDLDVRRLKKRSRIEMGSRWRIFELPAVVLASSRFALVLFEAEHFKWPKVEVSRIRNFPLTLEGCVETFHRLSCEKFIVKASRLSPAKLPFTTWRPQSVQGRHVWRTEKDQRQLRDVLSAIGRLNALMQLRDV